MNGWIWVSLILAIMVVALIFMLNKKNMEKALLKKQEEREWTLKVALEKTFNLPAVEAKELEPIEPQIDKIMNGPGSDEEVEEKMRLAVMSLYAAKQKRGAKEEPKKEVSNKDTNPPPRPPFTGRKK